METSKVQILTPFLWVGQIHFKIVSCCGAAISLIRKWFIFQSSLTLLMLLSCAGSSPLEFPARLPLGWQAVQDDLPEMPESL
jgi:hypothetical protein